MGVEYECVVCFFFELLDSRVSLRLDTAHRCDSRNLQEKLATLGAALDQALQVRTSGNLLTMITMYRTRTSVSWYDSAGFSGFRTVQVSDWWVQNKVKRKITVGHCGEVKSAQNLHRSGRHMIKIGLTGVVVTMHMFFGLDGGLQCTYLVLHRFLVRIP